jgi:hypothetical protein
LDRGVVWLVGLNLNALPQENMLNGAALLILNTFCHNIRIYPQQKKCRSRCADFEHILP